MTIEEDAENSLMAVVISTAVMLLGNEEFPEQEQKLMDEQFHEYKKYRKELQPPQDDERWQAYEFYLLTKRTKELLKERH